MENKEKQKKVEALTEETALASSNETAVESPYIIEMRHITKIFPGIRANDDITIQLKRGGKETIKNQRKKNER